MVTWGLIILVSLLLSTFELLSNKKLNQKEEARQLLQYASVGFEGKGSVPPTPNIFYHLLVNAFHFTVGSQTGNTNTNRSDILEFTFRWRLLQARPFPRGRASHGDRATGDRNLEASETYFIGLTVWPSHRHKGLCGGGNLVLPELPSSPMSMQSCPIPDTVILGFRDKVPQWLLTPALLIILDHKVA